MELPFYTVVATVGPSNCGKTTLCKKLVEKLSKYNVGYLSSDDIRRELVGDNLSKYDSRMSSVSSAAFDILHFKLENYLRYPVRKQFVIVDTTGMSTDFRNKIKDICKANHYNYYGLVFCFKSNKDYFKFDGGSVEVIKRHIKRLKEEEIRKMNMFDKKYDIREPVNDLDISIIDEDLYEKCHSVGPTSFIVGDIHSCVDELKTLLTKVGFEIKDDKIEQTHRTKNVTLILIGDIIDKGSDEKIIETIKFIHANKNSMFMKLIVGNHERTVYDLLKGISKESQYKDDLIQEHFSTYLLLKEGHDDIKNMFFEIYDSMIPFVEHVVDGDSFIATHAPCSSKYLGKLDKQSIKKQQYFYLNRDQSLYDNMSRFIGNDTIGNPYHIFGHVVVHDVYNGKTHYKNRNNLLMVDTGCIGRNKLSGVFIGACKMRIVSVPFENKQPGIDYVFEHMVEKPGDSDVETKYKALEGHDKYRVESVVFDSVNYISGTVCPASSSIAKHSIEDLEAGLNYFRDNGLDKVVMQYKYMGSRCQVYLFRDFESTYFVSRNGYKIKSLSDDTRQKLHKQLIDRLGTFMDDNGIEAMIVDCELMPWNAMGKVLIEKCFSTIQYGANKEVEIMKDTGFYELFKETEAYAKSTDFFKDQSEMKKKDLITKYGQHTVSSFSALKEADVIDPDEEARYLQIYNDQLEIYASDEEIHLKPFNILKIVYSDHEEIPSLSFGENSMGLDQASIFKLLSDDPVHVVDFSTENWLNDAESFYENATMKNKMEGVMIKPILLGLNYANCIKVRNEDYLTIIYGHMYRSDERYKKHIHGKRINKKLKTSIEEFKIGYEMLKQPLASLNKDNLDYLKSVMDFVVCEKAEEFIDPRL